MNDPNVPLGPPSHTPPPPPGDHAPGAPPPPPPGGAPPPPGGAAPPPPAGGHVSPNRGLMIVLSYLWLLALIPLLTEKEDKEVQWHAKHGLVLLVAEIILGIGLAIVSTLITTLTGGLDFGCSGCVLFSIYWIGLAVVHVLCIMKGVNGERFVVPGVTPFVEKL